MKKILVVGVKGMAGHMIYNFFNKKKLYDVYGVARNIESDNRIFNIDVSNLEAISEILHNNKFDYVINCIGILNKNAEDNPSNAIWYNSYFPHYLEEITKNTATKVIHISTDCVFSGKKGGYTESDYKDGVGFYAQSKALGEIANNKDVTIRTSIIGPELNQKGIGLFHWFMMQPKEEKLKGFINAYWSGITTLELSKVILEIINQNITGLIQVAPVEKIDKYSLISLFNNIYKRGEILIEEYADYFVDKSLKSIRTDFDYEIPGYDVMLENQKAWILENANIYSHYIK